MRLFCGFAIAPPSGIHIASRIGKSGNW